MSYENGKKFCIGNQQWRNTNPLAKMGRPRIYEEGEAEKMWTDALAYFDYQDNNPLEIDDWVGKDAVEVTRLKPLPYTIEGFCLWVGASHSWWKEFKNRKDLSPDFVSVIRAIEDAIFHQQYTGATAGLFQHNIVARRLGLAEATKVDADVKHKVDTVDYTKLSDDALREIAAAGIAKGPDGVADEGEG